jgi:hypothetical protein
VSEPVQPAAIQALARAVPQALAMLAGMELGVFTPLRDGPLTVEQLSLALGVRADKLQPLLRVLVSAGLLTADLERFANTPESNQFLDAGFTDITREMLANGYSLISARRAG